ncbi:DUF1266 domain-containing protein [Glutamicibacter sp. PS]|uniref:DUF1266 domain-containing protein n=1 Tax=Glutamicibacter sp. PS TaxID=3075634 RepID=UPI002842A220|nr:DUF1266 domain-containing protein [Glutamicibacter sp. PS]MDR4534711.1 DUF1266 domain-containing protein [Glutamicibacter sp. PS]
MDSSSTTFVILLFGAVTIFGVVAIGCSLTIRKQRTRLFTQGPGHASVEAPQNPWRRFSCALAAPYTRVEWTATRGARRSASAEQTWFGYAAAVAPNVTRQSLARDWGVRTPKHAVVKVAEYVQILLARGAADVSDLREEDATALKTRLVHAGAPEDAVADLLAAIAQTPPGLTGDRDATAFDIARLANLIRWSASTGLLPLAEAQAASDRVGAVAVAVYGSWQDYATSYLAGLRASGVRGTKGYVSGAQWLLEDPASPWVTESWPAHSVR